MESIMKELDIAIEPYCEAEIVWNFSPVRWNYTTKAKKVDIRKLPFDL